MEPLTPSLNTFTSPVWDTPEYWEKREAREKLMRAREVARKDRPRRTSDRKRAAASRRRNRRG